MRSAIVIQLLIKIFYLRTAKRVRKCFETCEIILSSTLPKNNCIQKPVEFFDSSFAIYESIACGNESITKYGRGCLIF